MTPEQQAAIDAATARLGGGVTTPGGQTFTPEQLEIMETVSQRLQAKGYDVVKTLKDGSQVLQFDDGSMQVLNQEAGLASKDPDVIAAAMRGELPVEVASKKRAEEIVSQAPAGARAAKFLEGVPFVGSFTDEILGQTPREEAQIRGMQSAMGAANPDESLGLQISGGVTGGSLAGLAAAPLGGANLIQKISQLPTGRKLLAYLGLGGSAGGIEGSIYGAGTGDTSQERTSGAQQGGLLGFATGAGTAVGVPALGNLLSKGWANIGKEIRKLEDDGDLAKQLGISLSAAKVIRATVQTTDSDLASMLEAIERAGKDGMIADADVATQVLLDAAAASGGGSAAIVRSAVDERARKAGQSLGATMDKTIIKQPKVAGQAADIKDIATSISESTRAQRKAAYDKAYQTPIDYSADAGAAIEAVIKKVPSRTLRKAIEEANDAMQAGGAGQRQIMADIGADGAVDFKEMPNIVQLDYIKRALGEIGMEIDSLGRPTAEAARAQNLRRELSKAITAAAPSYGAAMRLGGDKKGRDSALVLGRKTLNKNITPRELVRELINLDEGQRMYARVGLRDLIQETIDNVKATIASPDVDINALRDVLRNLSSKASQSKVKVIIGQKDAKKLFKELEKANAALTLKAAVAVNSKTAARQATQTSVEKLTGPGATEALMRAEPLKASAQVIQTITGETGEYVEAQKTQVMREIAKAMTQARGKEAKRQLKVIYNAVRRNEASQEQFQQASDFLINSVTLPATMFGVSSASRETVQ